MDIFVAGATGVVGRRLVPMLVDQGHRVVGTTTNPSKIADLTQAGVEGVVVDLLDGDAVQQAVAAAAPDVIIHQATALSGPFDLKRIDETFAVTNQLRTAGLDHLLDAAARSGVGRVIAQSFAGYTDPADQGLTDETTPFDPAPLSGTEATRNAIAYLEQRLAEVGGVALRYGMLYGPGTTLDTGGEIAQAIAKGMMPVVGGGAGVWSFVHVNDAAAAAVAAIDAPPGVYNIVDDEPAPVAEWLPTLAEELGAKPPKRIPAWLARPIIGRQGVRMMTQAQGASNRKAKERLGWVPARTSWRAGFGDAR